MTATYLVEGRAWWRWRLLAEADTNERAACYAADAVRLGWPVRVRRVTGGASPVVWKAGR